MASLFSSPSTLDYPPTFPDVLHLFTITSRLRPYDVYKIQGSFDHLFSPHHLAPYKAIITDKRFTSMIEKKMPLMPIYGIDAIETHKSFTTVESIWRFFFEHTLKKTDRVLIIGGGIIHDIGTLAATLYKRGIFFDYMPTTLLSMVDACIGGKCAVNAVGIKNSIGTISPSFRIYIHDGFLKILPVAQILGGLAEAAKTAFIGGADIFQTYCHQTPSFPLKDDSPSFWNAISLSLRIKKQLIEEDEDDQSVRRYLNFGHTFAHAIESATCHQIDHGLAVALGMRCAIQMAKKLDFELAPHTDSLDAYLQKLCHADSRVRSHLSTTLSDMDWHIFLNAFLADKKHHHDHIHLVLPVISSDERFGVSCHHFTLTDLFVEDVRQIFKELVDKKA